MTTRYDQLAGIIAETRPQSIVEVGTWNGDRAISMVWEALKHRSEVEYRGFDMFEDASAEDDAREFNVKLHVPLRTVMEKLGSFSTAYPGAVFQLTKGNSREVLPELAPDLAFIDGGHSIETITSDYTRLKNSRIVVLDDYYVRDREGRLPDIGRVGCNLLVAELPHAEILPKADPVKGGGLVQMVLIRR